MLIGDTIQKTYEGSLLNNHSFNYISCVSLLGVKKFMGEHICNHFACVMYCCCIFSLFYVVCQANLP